jgi:MFS family permease
MDASGVPLTMPPSLPKGRQETAATAQSVLVAASFALLLAGSNAVYPLLPVYRGVLRLDPFVLSLTFTLYVVVLVIALFALARPRFARHAVPLLLASLSTMIVADVLMSRTDEALILGGRVLGGIAGGLGTGAASALVVAAIGSRGRAVTATGNTVGGVLGFAGSQLVVALLAERAPQKVFLGHAAIVGTFLIAVCAVLWIRREANRSVLAAAEPGLLASARVDRSAVRLLVTGAVAWTGVSVAVVFGATVFAELHQPLVQAIGPFLLLCASAVAQLSSRSIARIAGWASGMLAVTAGIAGILAGAWIRADLPALAGFAILGAGIGIAYRAALVALTRGAAAARQGALASLYAAVTYSVAAAVVALVGWVGNLTGLVPAAIGALATLGVAAIAATAWAPRLRDTDNF